MPVPTGSAYSAELYDDCRDAFDSISVAALRQLWASSLNVADLSELGGLADDDVRGMLKIACLVWTTGDEAPWGDLTQN